MSAVAAILLGSLVTAGAAWAAGTLLFRAAGLRLYRGEQHLLAFSVGSAVLSAVVWILGAAHLARKGVFLGLAAALVACAVWRRARGLKPLPRLPRWYAVLFVSLFTVFAALYFVNAVAPDVTPAGSGWRMAMVARWWRERGFPPATSPRGMELLSLVAYSFGRQPAAAMVRATFLGGLSLLMLSWGGRFGMPGAGVLGALLVFASPAMGAGGAPALPASLFGAFYLLMCGDRRAKLIALLPAAFALTLSPLEHWPPGGPLQAAVFGSPAMAPLGPVFLMLPLALLALRRTQGRYLLAGAAATAVTGVGALPFVALALGVSLASAPGAIPALALAHAFFSWPAAVDAYCSPDAPRWRTLTVRRVLRMLPEEDYLRRRLPGYDAARLVEEFTPADARVFAFMPVPVAYTSREIVGDPALAAMLRAPFTPELQPSEQRRFRFPPREMKSLRLSADREWSATEVRVYSGDKELPRQGWQLRAEPDTAAVQLAFDNSYATRWSGQWLEVEFPQPARVDAVAIESVPQQAEPRIDGVSAHSQKASVMPTHLREAAAGQLRARGIRYLLVPDSETDFAASGAIWGIRPVGERGGAHLYRLD